MSNTKIQRVKANGTTYDIDLPSDAAIDISSVTTDALAVEAAGTGSHSGENFYLNFNEDTAGLSVKDGTDTEIAFYPTSEDQLYVYDDGPGAEGFYTFRTGISGVVATLDDISAAGGSSYTLSGNDATLTLSKDGTAQNIVTVNNVSNATTATKLGSATVGSSTKPIYLSAGTATASTSTVGASNKPVYLNSGTITASSSTIGSGTKPIYMSSGTIYASSSTVGSSARPVYLSSGTFSAVTYPSANTQISTSASTGDSVTLPAGGVIASHFSQKKGTQPSTNYQYEGRIELANATGMGLFRFGQFQKSSGSQSAVSITFTSPMRGMICTQTGATSTTTATASNVKTVSNAANTAAISVILQDGYNAAASEWSNAHKVTSVSYTGFTYYHGASEAITMYYIAIGEAA